MLCLPHRPPDGADSVNGLVNRYVLPDILIYDVMHHDSGNNTL